jgi:transcriptional regulator with XRE-family HTH domain
MSEKMSEKMRWREKTRPVLEEIRRLLKEAGLNQTQVEERAGFSKGYLSQLMGLNLDLKVKHVLAVLEAMEGNPGELFSRAYPNAKKRHRALDDFQRASGPLTSEVEEILAYFYKHGVESLRGLRDRLERCEQAVARIEASGILDEFRRRKQGG